MAPEPARDADRRPEPKPKPYVQPDPDLAEASPQARPEDGAVASRDPSAATGAASGHGRRFALSARLSHAVARARRIPPGAAAAGAIGATALVLALLAGDGDTEFPSASFEAGLLSQTPPPPAAEPSEAAMAPAARAPDALAERLVEDPVFDPRPRLDEPAVQRDAEPSLPPDARAGAGEGGTARDAIAVLAGASPPPADPALRVLESLRRRPSPTSADVAPVPPAGGNVAAELGFTVQLAAMARREQALTAWDRLYRDNADLLGRLQPIIVVPERKVSTLFRLRAGPLASAREARTLCASLAKRGVDCIVVKPGG